MGGLINNQITSLVSNDPSIQSLVIDMNTTNPVGVVGRIYNFKISAINNAGSVNSSALSVALASLPSMPDIPPFYDPAGTN